MRDCDRYNSEFKRRICRNGTIQRPDGSTRQLTPNERERYLAVFDGRPVPPSDGTDSQSQNLKTLKPRELGDHVESALSIIGITKNRVEQWLGRPCGCDERREKLNQLSRWAKRVLGGKTDNAEQYLNKIIEDG